MVGQMDRQIDEYISRNIGREEKRQIVCQMDKQTHDRQREKLTDGQVS
jgi:hypothetical protein